MVELAALEKRYGATHRGFESLSLRHRYYENHHYNNRKKARSLGSTRRFSFFRASTSTFCCGNDYILPHSSFEGDRARQEESGRIFSRLNSDDFVILLDERGKNLSSPELSDLITEHTDKHIVFIIGGAYGVTSDLRQKSNIVWSLSNLVFPHQLVRLILAEQLYRAQEIHRGSHYHHS